MKVYDLRCGQGHGFEGWFASADAFEEQRARGLVTCPACGDGDVQRAPSAARINLGARPPRAEREAMQPRLPAPAHASPTDGAAPPPAAPAAAPDATERFEREALQQAVLRHVARHLMANSEDVGRRFAQEARRIHHGDAPARAIRGQATPHERAELREEGIETFALPVPDDDTEH